MEYPNGNAIKFRQCTGGLHLGKIHMIQVQAQDSGASAVKGLIRCGLSDMNILLWARSPTPQMPEGLTGPTKIED